MPKEDLYGDEDISYREDEGEESFDTLADELFPDADPVKLKKLIRLCYEEDKARDEEGGEKGGIALILGGPKPKGK